MVARSMTITYGVLSSFTSRAGSHAVDPSGRCASRTRTQPGSMPSTGSTDGRPSQVDGTVPLPSCPGLRYRGEGTRTVAISVLAGTQDAPRGEDGPGEVATAGSAATVPSPDGAPAAGPPPPLQPTTRPPAAITVSAATAVTAA